MKSEEYVCCISFPWDCSSIGQSTALSRRKLRVRAPSVPTNPINNNPIKKIHQFISSFSVKGVQIAEFRSQRGSLLLFYIIYRFYIYIFIDFIFIYLFSLFSFFIKANTNMVIFISSTSIDGDG